MKATRSFRNKTMRLFALLVFGALCLTQLFAGAATESETVSTLRVVLDQDLSIIDPFWTTAHVTRNHGYLIYDTLFSLDESMSPQPQMIDNYTMSDDGMEYSFTLRDGLQFHDGAPVTAADCVASIQRWGARDQMGQRLMANVGSIEAVDTSTFVLELESPFGLVIDAFAKADSNVLFIMPERVARTDPFEQITDPTGSGPFIMVQDEWEPGNKVVYSRNEDYVPRSEAPSMLAGGKIAGVDRIEFVYMPDTGTAYAAMLAGEVHYYHEPPVDQVEGFNESSEVTVKALDPLGSQGVLRFNFLHPPFNDQRAREAVLWAMSQEEYMEAVVGNDDYYVISPAYFMSGTALETDINSEALMSKDLDRARELLAESGYDGEPVVMLDMADKPFHHAIAMITADRLREIGMEVEIRSMPVAQLMQQRQIKDPPADGGWNIFHTDFPAMAISSPLTNSPLNGICDGSNWPGWPCNPTIEDLKSQFIQEPDADARFAIAEAIQTEAFDFVTHGIFGQYLKLTAVSNDLSGVLFSPVPIFWNIEVESN